MRTKRHIGYKEKIHLHHVKVTNTSQSKKVLVSSRRALFGNKEIVSSLNLAKIHDSHVEFNNYLGSIFKTRGF